MKSKLISGIVLLLLALIFSLQNAAPVEVKFLLWQFNTSLALVIFSALAAGLAGGVILNSAARLMSKGEKPGA